MSKDLYDAHKANDKCVWEAYNKGYKINDEESCICFLLKLYKKMRKNQFLFK